ncbi:MAG: arsenite methyltransferase [Planctomycetota bacterium]|nr:arsenite methyltransferase [Planctomycetota bacterium]
MAPAAERPAVLFLCTGNSCRSQMAEGWARALHAGRFDAYSAGTQPHGLNPLAVRVMAEAGVDISRHASKTAASLAGVPIDLIVTVCDRAHEACPLFSEYTRTVHAPFDDPPRLAAHAASDDDALPHYRRVRDEIRRFVEALPQTLFGDSTMTKRSCCDDSCCPPATAATTTVTAAAATAPLASTADIVREQVRAGYAKIAGGGCCGPSGSGGGCCGATAFSPDQLAQAIGYASGELSAVPDGANMGLSCGNPTAIASLRPGEVVLDLGSGGGFDCFVAGPKVGAAGRVIGVDMTPDMLAKARRNTASYRAQTGLDNVEFRLGEIESLPAGDASVDVVISNCVLNLSPDKARVWREIARVLKPGGRVAVSDLALVRPLPDAVRDDVEALIGCVAGAVLVEETRAMAAAAGLSDITLTPKPQYIDAMTNWEDPLYRRIVEKLPAGSKPSDFVTSLDVSAVKR